jgi:hypothetical protein
VLEDRGKALERMEKMMGMYLTEGKVGEVTGMMGEGFDARLRRARERVEARRRMEPEEEEGVIVEGEGEPAEEGDK